MRKDLIHCWSSRWVVVQNFLNEISGCLTNLEVLRELVIVHSDSLVCSLDIVCLKRWLTYDQGVNDDTK